MEVSYFEVAAEAKRSTGEKVSWLWGSVFTKRYYFYFSRRGAKYHVFVSYEHVKVFFSRPLPLPARRRPVLPALHQYSMGAETRSPQTVSAGGSQGKTKVWAGPQFVLRWAWAGGLTETFNKQTPIRTRSAESECPNLELRASATKRRQQ